jgi:HSP20 family protein
MAKIKETTLPVVRTEREVISPLGGWPFGLMHRFAEEMERMFENFGTRRGVFPVVFPREVEETSWAPAVEVFEKNGYWIVRAELPGLTKEHVKVEITDEMLVIEGERKHEKEEKGEHVYRSERSYGTFYRGIPLPEGVNPETARATYKDGVLEVTLVAPLTPEKHARRVEIGEALIKEVVKTAA